jgi:CheY-like chemotaxis protein
MIKDRVPSVLILDVGLPDMSGQDLIAELRQNPATYSLPLIVHTTLDLSEEEKTQMQLGPSRFVTKATAFSDRLGELITEVTE